MFVVAKVLANGCKPSYRQTCTRFLFSGIVVIIILIIDMVPYNELLGLYGTLHEADIEKSYFDTVLRLANALKCDIIELMN